MQFRSRRYTLRAEELSSLVTARAEYRTIAYRVLALGRRPDPVLFRQSQRENFFLENKAIPFRLQASTRPLFHPYLTFLRATGSTKIYSPPDSTDRKE